MKVFINMDYCCIIM